MFLIILGLLYIFRLFTICDLDPESEMNIFSISLLIVLFLHASASSPKKSSSLYIFSVTLALYCSLSLSYFCFFQNNISTWPFL